MLSSISGRVFRKYQINYCFFIQSTLTEVLGGKTGGDSRTNEVPALRESSFLMGREPCKHKGLNTPGPGFHLLLLRAPVLGCPSHLPRAASKASPTPASPCQPSGCLTLACIHPLPPRVLVLRGPFPTVVSSNTSGMQPFLRPVCQLLKFSSKLLGGGGGPLAKI